MARALSRFIGSLVTEIQVAAFKLREQTFKIHKVC